MPKLRNLAAIVAAAEAARRYAKSNPEQAGKYLDQAAAFVDKQTKGRYSSQISGVTGKVKDVAGIPATTVVSPAEVNGSVPSLPSPTPRP
jgi:hypothetical protein